MKLCRFQQTGVERLGLYDTDRVLPLDDLASTLGEKYLADILQRGDLQRLLPTDSPVWTTFRDLVGETLNSPNNYHSLWLSRAELQLLPPIGNPPKLLLLAGNYAAHVREQGDMASEREKTFPYVFMKPPTTTLVGDQCQVRIPELSPHKIDHEVELAVIIGREARNIKAADALAYVAGYTIINDLSDRSFRPNSTRDERPRDKFFDWLHGKWHDGFCPCGPCMVTSDQIADPQQLELNLSVDGELRQSGSTAEQVFSVAEVLEFISSWVTLEPGDIICTGTPAGVGNATGKFLAAGQEVVATVSQIGSLTTRMI